MFIDFNASPIPINENSECSGVMSCVTITLPWKCGEQNKFSEFVENVLGTMDE